MIHFFVIELHPTFYKHNGVFIFIIYTPNILKFRSPMGFYQQGYLVSVVNPLSVKRFIQMKLSKIKTDKSDAKAICDYAIINEVPLYTAKEKCNPKRTCALTYLCLKVRNNMNKSM